MTSAESGYSKVQGLEEDLLDIAWLWTLFKSLTLGRHDPHQRRLSFMHVIMLHWL
jgi:hypothetical protein